MLTSYLKMSTQLKKRIVIGMWTYYDIYGRHICWNRSIFSHLDLILQVNQPIAYIIYTAFEWVLGTMDAWKRMEKM